MDINSLFPSNFLKAADLQGQPRTVTIESCALEQLGDGENKPVLRFVGIPKGLVLNRTNATVIANAFGGETTHWTGKQVTLFSMPVSFQGRMVDGIRVQAAPPSAPAQPTPDSPPAQAPQPAPAEASEDDIPW